MMSQVIRGKGIKGQGQILKIGYICRLALVVPIRLSLNQAGILKPLRGIHSAKINDPDQGQEAKSQGQILKIVPFHSSMGRSHCNYVPSSLTDLQNNSQCEG
jgi:hypothetical protein